MSMTAFAHIGGGIAVAAAVQYYVFKEEITPAVIVAGVLLGLLPDLDSFLALLFGKWSPGVEQLSHHSYFTHTPIFYLFVSGLIWFILDWKWALLFLAVTLTHLLMDSWSTDDGIMWLWPLRKEQYSFFSMDSHAGGVYGLQFYTRYVLTPRLIVPELVFVAAGAVTIIRFVLRRYLSMN